MLQCVAVCCSVLQCVAVCCSMLQCVAVRCSALQCVAVCCNVTHMQALIERKKKRVSMCVCMRVHVRASENECA